MEQASELALGGLHIAILVTDGFEQAEFTEPKKALEQAGAITKVISDKHGQVQGFNHDTKADLFDVNLTFTEADAEDFDAVVLPGGHINSGRIREIPQAQNFVKSMQADGKPIAVICHGAWLLVSADLVKDRTLTSYPSLQEEVRNAGGNWVDQEVVVDGNWVSSRKPADLPAFNQKTIEVIAELKNKKVRGTEDENAVGTASS
jgi:protease I